MIMRLWIGSVLVLAGTITGYTEHPTGIALEKPQSGRYIETEIGYMVPYTATIPGTDIEFAMTPISNATRTADGGRPFWIGTHEVTLREFKEYAKLYEAFQDLRHKKQREVTVGNGADAVSAPTMVYDPMGRFVNVKGYNYPAYSMTLYAAKQYTKWLSLITSSPYRLPTETEWQHAAKAGTAGYYWREEQLRPMAVFNSETEDIVEVGTRQPNPWGLYDVYGNVSEWVITELASDITVKSDANEQATNDNAVRSRADLPIWPPLWVHKGGNFASTLEQCQFEKRALVDEDDWSLEANFPVSVTWLGNDSDRVRVGFRIVRELGKLDRDAMLPYWEAASEELRWRIQVKLEEGRGIRGLVDPALPAIVREMQIKDVGWKIPE